MAKQLNSKINLSFTADTSQAKSQLKSLQDQLSKLSSANNLKISATGLTKELQQASDTAGQLQAHLQAATNVDTGKLDLNKFSMSLKNSGLTMQKIREDLVAFGPAGVKAFTSLSTSITQAEVPLLRVSAKLKELGTTMANTARWQISSSVLHGFMGAIQGAYGYAQDLNESLNNIRIVTGQTTDQMAKFAKEANNSAKALSTTTTEYTDAALIYYQQGLSDKEVKERTDATVKMANVARQSAETVSDQMTAVWNNFYEEGEKSLEYYADVMTKLGAATASSTDEIATGLEKFAAISKTVGLSYEYAASALATVTATTRQSADTVGTAFRTLFSRLEGLSLGETLDDGTTLNKYSKALETVGVNIKNQYGELKNMDTILDELGDRWGKISKEQQVALAQTVGGARQYATLIALMDNWDFFQENLATSYGAEGELNRQSEIYAESWEAASDRVTAAWEKIYATILNDEFFIDLTNAFGKLVEVLGKFIDGIGGAKGALFLVTTVLQSVYKNNIANAFQNGITSINNLKDAWGKAAKSIKKDQNIIDKAATFSKTFFEKSSMTGQLRKDTFEELKTLYEGNSFVSDIARTMYKDSAKEQAKYLEVSDSIADAEKIRLQMLLKQRDLLVQQTSNLAEQERLIKEKEKGFIGGASWNIANANKKTLPAAETQQAIKNNLKAFQQGVKTDRTIINLLGDSKLDWDQDNYESLMSARKYVLNMDKNLKLQTNGKEIFGDYYDGEQWNGKNSISISQAIEELKSNWSQDKLVEIFSKLRTSVIDVALQTSNLTGKQIVKDLQKKFNEDSKLKNIKVAKGLSETEAAQIYQTGIDEAALMTEQIGLKAQGETVKKTAKKVVKNANPQKDAKDLQKVAQSITTISYGLSAVNTMWDTFADDSLSWSEKFSGAMTSVMSLMPMLPSLLTSFKDLGSFLKIGSIGAGLLSASILILIKLLQAVGDAYYKWTHKQEILRKELETAQQAANNATSSYNDLKDSIESLESAKTTLAGLTKGTEEWSEAVLKVNQQVLDLIENYPELAQYLNSNDGILGIDKEGLDAVVKSQQQQALLLQQRVLNKQAEIANQEVVDRRASLKFLSLQGNEGGYKQLTGLQQQEIGKLLLNSGAIKGGKVDWSTISSDKNNPLNFYKYYSDAIDENLTELINIAKEAEANEKKAAQTEKITAHSWLENQEGLDDVMKEAYATGIASIIDETWRTNATSKYASKADEDLIKEYSQLTNQNAETVQELIDAGKLTVNDIRDLLEMNWMHQQAYEQVENNLGKIKNFEGQEGYGVWSSIVAADGNQDAWNALTPEQVQELLAVDSNSAFGKAIDKALPEITLDQIKQAVSDTEYEAISRANRYAAHDTAAGLQAQSIISEEGFDEKEMEAYTERLIENNKALEEYEGIAKLAAAVGARLNKGLEALQENFHDNAYAIKNADKNSKEYSDAMEKMKEAVADVVNAEEDMLSDEFIVQHLGDIEKAANGDVQAIENLQAAAAKDILIHLDVSDDVMGQLEGLHNDIWDFTNEWDFTVSPTIDNKDFLDKCNELVALAGMTVAEADEYFKRMGYDVEVVEETRPGKTTTRTQTVKDWYNADTGEWENGSGTITEVSPDIVATAIKSITYTGKAGGHVNYSNTKAGGAQAKPRSGGGGSQKASKSMKSDSERYYVITRQIEALNKELDRLGTLKDRAFGRDKIALMDEEIARTQQMIDSQKEYISQIEGHLSADKGLMAGYGAQFDEYGVITNYDQLMQQQIDKFNASKSDAAEEAFENFEQALKQYEETNELYMEQHLALLDLENQLADLRLEKIQYQVELKLDIADDDLKYFDFLLGQIGDSAYDAADAIATLGQKAQSTFEKMNAYEQGLQDLFNNYGYEGDILEYLNNGGDLTKLAGDLNFTEEGVETLREYRDGLLETTEELLALKEEVRSKVVPAFDDLTNEMDKEIDKLEHLNSVLEHYRNLVDLVGKDNLGITDELMSSLSDATVDNALAQLTSNTAKLNGMKGAYAQAELRLADALSSGDDDAIKYWEDTLDELGEKIRTAENEYMNSWEATLKTVTDAYDDAVTRSIERFEKAMSGTYGNLEALKDAYDKHQEAEDRYLEDYEQIYELSKLNRDINNSLDNTDNIKGKQMLLELQKEINDLEDAGVKLSEYDLDFLRKKYELRLAEIALEEAQNAKSQVRMTRDSEGNWSYTYTADETNVQNAQQNYEDKLYAIQQLSSEHINNLTSQIIDAQIQMNQELAQLRADDEEGRQAVIDHYQGQIDFLIEQMNHALDNNKMVYEEDWTAYHDATGYKISDNDEFLMNFEDTALSMMTGFDDLQSYHEAFTEASGVMYEDIANAAEEWYQRTEEAMRAAGTSVQDFASDMQNAMGNVREETEETKQDVIEFGTTMPETFETALRAVDNFENNYVDMMNSIIDANSHAVDSINDLIRALEAQERARRDKEFGEVKFKATHAKDTTPTDGGYKNGEYESETGKTKYVAVVNGVRQTDKVFDSAAEALKYGNSFKDYDKGIMSVSYQRYNTGGYTGDWHSKAGKLAVLHEKELVLNKEDTRNILDSVTIVRSLSDWISAHANSMARMNNNVMTLDNFSNSLQQDVVIHAEFPNANNRVEIEAAFDNLINRASQYANRKG